MSLHTDVGVPALDRRRLERLCHYVAALRSRTIASQSVPDGRLALRLKTRWRDGTTPILMEPDELLERLVPLIPPRCWTPRRCSLRPVDLQETNMQD